MISTQGDRQIKKQEGKGLETEGVREEKINRRKSEAGQKT